MGAFRFKRPDQQVLARVLRAVPAAAGAAHAVRRHAVRRRAADAGDRPGADGQAAAAAARRAVDGPGAADRAADLRHRPRDQHHRRDRADRRAERRPGARRWPTAATCSRPARSCSPAPARSCWPTTGSARRTSARRSPPESAPAVRRRDLVDRVAHPVDAQRVGRAGDAGRAAGDDHHEVALLDPADARAAARRPGGPSRRCARPGAVRNVSTPQVSASCERTMASGVKASTGIGAAVAGQPAGGVTALGERDEVLRADPLADLGGGLGDHATTGAAAASRWRPCGAARGPRSR